MSSKYYRKVKRRRKEADKLWKEAVYDRWGRICTVCGKPADDAHHFVPRSMSAALRLDVKNGVPLCRKHHFAHHNGDPEIHARIIKRRGEKWYNYVQEHRRDDTTTTLKFFNKAIKRLKKECQP